MRNKGADPGNILEGDAPEDECGVSSSVPHNGGVTTPTKWFSLSHPSNMRQHAFPNHTEMLYVNLEESCPSSPTYLERDPNMSCTARYSPASYASTTANSGVSQPPSLNTTPPSNSVTSQSGLPLPQHYQRQDDAMENQQHLLQYHTLNTDRIAPLLQVLESVATSAGESYYPSTVTDTFGVSSSNGVNVTSVPDQTNANIVSTTVCDQTPEVHPSIYMPITQQPSPTSTTQSSIGHSQTQLMDASDLQFILASDCEYHMMEGGKGDQVELFIARDPSGTSYSVTTENGFLIARPTMCAVKPESLDSEVNSIPVDVSILDSLDENTQFDEEHHNIVMETETLSSPNLHFNQSDELMLQSNSSDDMSPSQLEEVQCSQMVDLEEIAEYLGSQPPTPVHEEIFNDEIPLEKNRPNRRRQQQYDTALMCIPDKTVPCRARASLPAIHLSLKAGPESTIKGVFSKRRIPIRARFGPLEGCKKKLPKSFTLNNANLPMNQVKFLVRTNEGNFVFDVSDERTSNWMRYVRFEPGPLQNVCLHQSNNDLFFITCRPIAPKQELILGYGTEYAKLWGLPSPPSIAAESEETTTEWPCYECSLGFPTSSEFQAHLNSHDDEEKCASSKKAKKKIVKPVTSKSSNINSALLHSCDFCNKAFASIISLKRHLLVHDQIDNALQNLDSQSFPKKQPDSIMSSNKEQNMDFDECGIKNEECHNMDLEKYNSNNTQNMQSQYVEQQYGYTKRENNYHMEREQLVPDSQMDNDSLDSLNVEETYGVTVHMESLSSLDGNGEMYLCTVCNKVMDNALQLEIHSKDHMTNKIKSVPCPSCPTDNLNSAIQPESKIDTDATADYMSRDKNNVISRNAAEVNENKVEDKSVKRINTTARNKMICHCPVCPRTFKNGSLLKDHVHNQHMKADGKYDCPMCSMILPDYRGIKKHMRVYHAVKKISCPECGSNFATNDKLRLHVLKHSDRRDFVCGECGKQFKRRDKLKEHTKKQHSGDAKPVKVKELSSSSTADPTAYLSFTYKCHPCKRGFKRRGMLVNHLAKRHPDIVRTNVPELQMPILRVARNYFCQHCDKVYKSSSKRKAHIIKNHPGESIPPSARGSSAIVGKEGYSKDVGAVPSAPHACPHQPCHKQYASRAKLLQHIRLKHALQTTESKENNLNKKKNRGVESPISKSDVSSSTTTPINNIISDRHANTMSDFSDAKAKPMKMSYQEYDNVSEKMTLPNILTKSKIDQMSLATSIPSNTTNNKILSNLLNNGHTSQVINESLPTKPLSEIKLSGYLAAASSNQPSLSSKNVWRNTSEPPALINSVRNTSMRVRIIQLSDGMQIIEESDVHQMSDLQKKPLFSKVPGQLVMENNKLPPVSVLAGSSNQSRYTDR